MLRKPEELQYEDAFIIDPSCQVVVDQSFPDKSTANKYINALTTGYKYEILEHRFKRFFGSIATGLLGTTPSVDYNSKINEAKENLAKVQNLGVLWRDHGDVYKKNGNLYRHGYADGGHSHPPMNK